MIKKFLFPLGATPVAVTGARFNGQTLVSDAAGAATFNAFIIGGPGSGTVTLTVSAYTTSNSADNFFSVNGTEYGLGDTIVIPMDGSGNATITCVSYGAAHPGYINPYLTITAVSSGSIGSSSTSMTFSKTR